MYLVHIPSLNYNILRPKGSYLKTVVIAFSMAEILKITWFSGQNDDTNKTFCN